MLLKSCKRCGNLIPYGREYCKTCEPIAKVEIERRRLESKRASNKRYNKQRVSKVFKIL